MTEKLKDKLSAAVTGLILIGFVLSGAGVTGAETAVPDDLSGLNSTQLSGALQETETASDSYARARLIMISFALIALLSGLLSAFLVTRIITRQANLRSRTAGGGRGADGTDEAAQLLSAMRTMVKELQRVLLELQDSSSCLTSCPIKGAKERIKNSDASCGPITFEGRSSNTEEISKMLATIEEIAQEANLLALNSALETAGSRDRVASLAEMASEIRALAEKGQSAAEEISSLTARSSQAAEKAEAMLTNIVPAIHKTIELIPRISQG